MDKKNMVPVKVGQILKVDIGSVGDKGDGVAKVNGYAIFVPDTKPGECVKVRIIKALDKFAFAEVV